MDITTECDGQWRCQNPFDSYLVWPQQTPHTYRKGFGMARSKTDPHRQKAKGSLRLALALSLATSPLALRADSGYGQLPDSAQSQAAVANCHHDGGAHCKATFVQRWLGFEKRPAWLPTHTSRDQAPMSNQSTLVNQFAPPAALVQKITEPSRLPPGNVVTVAAEELPSSVQAELSDQPAAVESSLTDSANALDLMNSLESPPEPREALPELPTMPTPPAFVPAAGTVEVTLRDSAPPMDRMAEPTRPGRAVEIAMSSAGNEEASAASRQPQLIKSPTQMKIQVVGSSSSGGSGSSDSSSRSHRTSSAARQASASTQSESLTISGGAFAAQPLALDAIPTRIEDQNTSESPESTRLTDSSNSDRALPQSIPEFKSESVDSVVTTNHRMLIGLREAVKRETKHPIHAMSVEREDICQLIQTGSRSFSLIGLREGTTRIALITDEDGQRKAEIRQVVVGRQMAAEPDLTAIADNISRTVRELYPDSQVAVDVDGQALVVSGMAESEESARAIVSLIRKTALTPVIDQVTTH